MTIDLRDAALPADSVAAALELRPHPEGGRYREVWRDTPADGGRGASTSILFLLDAGERSHWHRVDADEIWHWQAGAPLSLVMSPDGRDEVPILLGPDLAAGQRLLATVPRGWWQAAAPLNGGWVLAACTVAPAFSFAGFELAPPGWRPSPGR